MEQVYSGGQGLKAKSRADIAANGLIQLIIDNDMEPGDKLPNEYELAETLEVGRNTLREAIRRLVARNILETRQGAGTFVSGKRGIPEDPLGLVFMQTVQSANQLALGLRDVRFMIEPEIAFLAAIHATSEQCEAIMAQLAEVERLMLAREDYSGADVQLHRLIADASGHEVLKNLLSIITSSIQAVIVTTSEQYRTLAMYEHRDICDAICNKDGRAARYAMIAHLSNGCRACLMKNEEIDNGFS